MCQSHRDSAMLSFGDRPAKALYQVGGAQVPVLIHICSKRSVPQSAADSTEQSVTAC